MTAAEIARRVRELECTGRHDEAARLRAELPTTPVPALLNLIAMTDTDLEILAEAVAEEMLRRAREVEADPQLMTAPTGAREGI